MRIVVLTTLYNSEGFIKKCIDSIKSQTYTNFKCYITDDISTDFSVYEAIKAIGNDNRFMIIENKTKFYQAGNYDQIIKNPEYVDDDDIIIEVDGDDWLPDENVFQRVVNIYNKSDCWMAYGNFMFSNGTTGFATPPTSFDTIRSERFVASHIRTWKAFLWRAIPDIYLKDENGNYNTMSCDVGFMFSMLELAGPEHFTYMSDINYVYNDTNPISEHRVSINKVNEMTEKLRRLPSCQRLIR